MTRVTREGMLMGMADMVALRGTCSRLRVGAVIARDSRVISTGYNGNVAGLNHCHHGFDDNSDGCTSAVHAEANAIAYAARYGVSVDGAALYVTHQPCLGCAKLIVNSGIASVIYEKPYRLSDGIMLLLAADIEVGEYDNYKRKSWAVSQEIATE